VLERQAKEFILQNIRRATDLRASRLIQLVRRFPQASSLPLSLKNFLRIYHMDLRQIYKKDTFSSICKEAGNSLYQSIKDHNGLNRFLRKRLPSIYAHNYLSFIRSLVANKMTWDYDSKLQNQLALMFYYDVFHATGKEAGFSTLKDALNSLIQFDTLLQELDQACAIQLDKIEVIPKASTFMNDFPLEIHGRYLRDHIVIALEKTTFEHKYPSREGVLYADALNTEALFVTLDKDSLHYTPNTKYDDYAINEFLFHWQSQNSAAPFTKAGQNYIQHERTGRRILLFVREANQDEFGFTSSFVFLGEATFQQYYGEKPMNITWSLSEPIPSYLLIESKKLAAG
jgi:hypothetical protein